MAFLDEIDRKLTIWGHGLDEQQMFCSNCGAKVEQQNIKVEDEQEEKIRCCNCGALLEAEQIFCTLCGTKIEKVVEAAIIEDEKNLEETEEFDKKKCSKCGVELLKIRNLLVMKRNIVIAK